MTTTRQDEPDSTISSTEVAIVGAGPIGLELAVALQQVGIQVQVFDAGSIGHTISWWAPQTRWFSSNERISIAGVPLMTADQSKATREQYLTYLRSIVAQFELSVQTHCRVENIEQHTDHFVLTAKTGSGAQHWQAERIVLAIGGTDSPRQLNIPGDTRADGYLRETHRYFGRRVLIIGGRNSAIEAALRLHHVGAKVALSYRGEALPEDGIKYWLLPEIKGLLRSGRIKDFVGTVPVEILPDAVRLEWIFDGETVEVLADDVLSLIGYEQNKWLLRVAGIELVGEMERPLHDETTMETNVKGIYVAGTATAGTQSSKYKIFLENCHDHIDKIVTHITGKPFAGFKREYADQIVVQPES